MTKDIPFLERDDYMLNGVMKYEIFCPLTDAIKRRKLGKARPPRKAGATGTGVVIEVVEPEPEPLATEHSALYYQYCPELHKMVAYMRRLDGAYPNTHQGHKIMDPLAPDSQPKWATNGRTLTPYFGWWTFHAWEKVFCSVFV